MAASEFVGLKNLTVKMSDSKDVEDTKILDGEASDSPVMNETNKTAQYSTDKLPSGDLGGMNNMKG